MPLPGRGVYAEGARVLDFQAKELRMLAIIRESKRFHLCVLTEKVPRLSREDLKVTKSRDLIVGTCSYLLKDKIFCLSFSVSLGISCFLK